MQTGEQKNQYHPPFCAAMELELREDREQIDCRIEHNLNSKPNRIDFLVIKVDENAKMKSGLGALFKKYNLFEYKSPQAALNRNIYYRSLAYANLLVAYEEDVSSMEDVTITFLRQGMPVKLMNQFREWGFAINTYEPGIYHVKKSGHVDMQIIVIRQLSKKYKWITKLTTQVEQQDTVCLLEAVEQLDNERDKLNAESVFDLMFRLNKNKPWMKEMIAMGELRNLFKKEFEEKDHKIEEQDQKIEEQKNTITALSEQLQNQSEQLQNQSEQLQNQSEQLQNQSEQLQNQSEENFRLKEEIARLKKQLGGVAML